MAEECFRKYKKVCWKIYHPNTLIHHWILFPYTEKQSPCPWFCSRETKTWRTLSSLRSQHAKPLKNKERKKKICSPTGHAVLCTAQPSNTNSLWERTPACAETAHISWVERWKLGHPPLYPSLPSTSFSPPPFHPSSLPNTSPSLICIPPSPHRLPTRFPFRPIAPPFPPPPPPSSRLVWNKTALSPLLLSGWPSAPCRILFRLPRMKVFVDLKHKHSLTFHWQFFESSVLLCCL